MRSNGTLPLTDTRRLSPQTTVSSGYHSDLSSATSANESPQSIQDILPVTLDKSSCSQIQKKTVLLTTNSLYEKPSSQKNVSRISSFLRKQYERAKSKFSSKSLSSSQAPVTTVITSSKATSTTPLSDDNYNLSSKQQQQAQHSLKPHYHKHYLSSVYKQNSHTEPVYSVYVHPVQKSTCSSSQTPQYKNYTSIHECYSHQPTYRYSAVNNSLQYSSSYRRLAAIANFENVNNYNLRRHQYYPTDSQYTSSKSYRCTNNNYELARSNYAPLSDFVSRQNSAFKPIKQKQFYQRPIYNQYYEQIPPSSDPCDLEVAQYFPHTSHWSNPNYFDIYTNDNQPSKTTYNETLC